MSQALYTSMGGINAASTAITVVSNNVANLNTTSFKAADTRFENLFSKTYTTGNSPTKTTGGINPMQVGMGVQVGSIVRNFTEGSYVATGSTSDLMISGGGYFTVMDAHGEIYLTRDGSFTLDSEGNMVTQSGFYVLGASQIYNTSASQNKVHVPQTIKTDTVGNEAMARTIVSDLNDAAITAGDFTIQYADVNGSKYAKINITEDDLNNNVASLIAKIEQQLRDQGLTYTDPVSGQTLLNVVPMVNLDGTIAFQAQPQYEQDVLVTKDIISREDGKTYKECQEYTTDDGKKYYWDGIKGHPMFTDDVGTVLKDDNGAIVYGYDSTILAAGGNRLQTLSTSTTSRVDPVFATAPFGGDTDPNKEKANFNPTLTFTAGTSNFLEATRLASAEQTADGRYTSKVLDYTVTVEPVAALSEAVSLESYSIANDGTIEATYSNGDKITVEANQQDNTFAFKYTTATGVVIRGTEHIDINPNICIPENLVLQMATVTNEAGLVSLNNNIWSVGPNTGEMVFAVGGSMGMGEIQSGGLEGSNVDLSRELSNMILAQRAIQANSRVFSTASSVMETLTYLGN